MNFKDCNLMFFVLFFNFLCYGQSGRVGIGTEVPKASLHVSGNIADNVLLLENMREDEIIKNYNNNKYYNSRVLTIKSSDIDASVNNIGIVKASKAVLPVFFYCPPMALPLFDNAGVLLNGLQTVDLYAGYAEQFDVRGRASTSVSSEDKNNLPILSSDEIIYHVTYYDNTVFTNVNVAQDGKLTYSLLPNSVVTDKTYMTILFEVKNT